MRPVILPVPMKPDACSLKPQSAAGRRWIVEQGAVANPAGSGYNVSTAVPGGRELDARPATDVAAPETGSTLGQQLKKFFFLLNKRKWWVILTFLAVLSAATMYTRFQKPVYRATASIIIETSPPRILSGVKEVVEMGSNNYWLAREYLQTQYKVITGLEVADRVVARLHLDEEPEYLGVLPGETLSDDTKNKRIEDKVPSKRVLGQIRVDPVRDSMMVQISVDDSDASRAMQIANEVVFAYRGQNIDYRRSVLHEANVELREMVEKYRTEKESADQELLQFEKEHNIGSFASRKQSLEDRVKLLNDRDRKSVV